MVELKGASQEARGDGTLVESEKAVRLILNVTYVDNAGLEVSSEEAEWFPKGHIKNNDGIWACNEWLIAAKEKDIGNRLGAGNVQIMIDPDYEDGE